MAEVDYSDAKTTNVSQQVSVLTPITSNPIPVDWTSASAVELPVEELEHSPDASAQFAELPGTAAKAKSYDGWQKDFATWIYRNQKLELLQSPAMKLASNPGESERDFRVRLQQRGREQRDEMKEKLRQKFDPKFAALQEKKRRAEQAVEREAEQAKGQKMQTAISFGATLLSSFMGRKSFSMSSLGKATTAARGVGRSMKESQDVDRAQETVEAVAQQMADLDAQFKADTDALDQSLASQTEQLETVSLKPKKSSISVKLVTLAWAPYWHGADNVVKPAWE